MNSPRVSYAPRPGATKQAELAALASAYVFILDSAKKRGRLPDKSGPNDGTKTKEDSADAPILHE